MDLKIITIVIEHIYKKLIVTRESNHDRRVRNNSTLLLQSRPTIT